MKTQIKFQKILFLATLIIAALSLVYGFAFCTGSLTYAFAARSGMFSASLRKDPIGADALYSFVIGKSYESGKWLSSGTGFNDLIVILSIVLVVIAALQFFFATNSRRNYYITNYISVGVLVAFAFVVAIIGFWGVAKTESLFNALDWATYKEVYDAVKAGEGMGWDKYSDSHVMFYLGYIMYALVLINAVTLVLNTVWKYLLMKGEKQLLSKNTNITEAEVQNEQAV